MKSSDGTSPARKPNRPLPPASEEKRADLEVTKIEAEISRAKRTDTADIDYDVQVLRNRERNWADEVLIGIFAGRG